MVLSNIRFIQCVWFQFKLDCITQKGMDECNVVARFILASVNDNDNGMMHIFVLFLLKLALELFNTNLISFIELLCRFYYRSIFVHLGF